MKINVLDTAKIAAALGAVNGTASAHTASAADVAAQAVIAEAHLAALGIAKKDRAGAGLDYVSGGTVSNAYTNKNWTGRAATRVRLTRGASGWFMFSATRVTVGQAGGWVRTLLTPDQYDIAHIAFRSGFGVVAAVPVPVAAAA